MSKSSSYYLNNIKLTSKNGEEFDIKGLLILANIFEDLFSNTMSAEIHIKDGVGLIESIPLIGEETVEFNFGVDGKVNFKHKFSVYAIEKVEIVSDRVQTYVIKLVSPEALINSASKIQKFYSGRSDNHVKSICENILKIDSSKLKITPTEYTKNIIVPNLKPFDYINYLASNSIVPNSNDSSSSFLFYQNKNNYVFTSIDKLQETSSNFKFIYNGGVTNNTQLNYNPFQIRKYHFERLFNRIDNIENGMYSGRLYSHDIITKEYKRKDFKYNDSFSDYPHSELEPIKLTKKEYPARSKSIFVPSGDRDHPNFTYNKTASIRMSQMQQAENYKLVLQCVGEVYTTVGDKINIRLPTISNTDSNNEDDLLSGEYLITAKRHVLTSSEYSSVLEVRKDCFKRS